MGIKLAYSLLVRFVKNRLLHLIIILGLIFILFFSKITLDITEFGHNLIEIILIFMVLTLALIFNSMIKSIKEIRLENDINKLSSVKFYRRLRLKSIITTSKDLFVNMKNIGPFFLSELGFIEDKITLTKSAFKSSLKQLFTIKNSFKILIFTLLIALTSYILKIGAKDQLNFYFLIFILTLLGGMLASVVGFGSKVLAISVLIFFIDIKTAVALVAAYSIFLYTSSVYFHQEHINKKLFLYSIIWLIPGLIIGLYIFKILDVSILVKFFSAFLILYVGYKIFFDRYKFHLNNFALGFLIFIYGIFAGSTGTGGPFLAAVLFQYGLKKEKFIGFTGSILLVAGIITTFGYFLMGFFQLPNLILLAILFISAILSAFIGSRVVQILPKSAFDYIMIILLLILGIKGIIF